MRRLALVAAAAVLVVATGCGSNADTTTLTISAAASLRVPFDELIEQYEADNGDVTVTVNYGASGELATQITDGAPADIAALASEPSMDVLTHAGLVNAPQTFATNSLVIVTKPGNPLAIRALDDLTKANVVALCGASAPCGTYATEILDAAGVVIPNEQITRGQDVKATLSAVTVGDADAAIVYATDARAAGDQVELVEIPTEQNAVVTYPIAVIQSGNNTAAQGFVDLVLSDAGRTVLANAGFGLPAGPP